MRRLPDCHVPWQSCWDWWKPQSDSWVLTKGLTSDEGKPNLNFCKMRKPPTWTSASCHACAGAITTNPAPPLLYFSSCMCPGFSDNYSTQLKVWLQTCQNLKIVWLFRFRSFRQTYIWKDSWSYMGVDPRFVSNKQISTHLRSFSWIF